MSAPARRSAAVPRLHSSIDHSFFRFSHERIHDRLEITGLAEHTQLAVGAGAVLQDAVGVLDLAAAAELIDDIGNEPLEQLQDQIAGRTLVLLAEIDQLAVESVTDGAPLVLLQQVGRVDAE